MYITGTFFWALIFLCFTSTYGQGRRRQPEEDNELADRRNIDPTFPYRRGDTPIMHFDVGDEVFLETIPELVKGLGEMTNLVGSQRRITQRFGEAFATCEECG